MVGVRLEIFLNFPVGKKYKFWLVYQKRFHKLHNLILGRDNAIKLVPTHHLDNKNFQTTSFGVQSIEVAVL